MKVLNDCVQILFERSDADDVVLKNLLLRNLVKLELFLYSLAHIIWQVSFVTVYEKDKHN